MISRLSPLAAFICLITTSVTFAEEGTSSKLEETFIYGEQGKTDTATKLELSIFETPQTVTAVSRAQLDEFALTSISDVLNYAPGITVEEVETNRTYYTARGFDIVNFQYDGVGIPFISGLNLGQQDTAIYEKVEIVKGSAGLITGLANPSATINYVRKRPSDDLQASAALSLGQWQNKRAEVDIATALSDSVRARAVVAYDNGETHLDRNENTTQLGYGIFEFDLSDNTMLTAGYSYDRNESKGVLWGALPLLYTDGSRTNYDVSTSNAPDWTFANTTQKQSFAELEHHINQNWTAHLHLTHNQSTYDSNLFYVYGTPERGTEVGLFGYASAYERDEEQLNVDLFVSGDFSLFERNHQLVLGYSDSDTNLAEASHYNNTDGFPVLGADWAKGNTPAMDFPDHDPATSSTDIDLSQKAFYVAARLNVLDNLALLLGARNTELEQTGVSYGGESNASANKTVPYFGVTYELIDSLMLYSSYSEVFKQQTWVNSELQPLGATVGASSELGLKKSFNDERSVLTLAAFSSEQSDFGVFVARNESGIAIYRTAELSSSGYELEFSGEVTDGLNIGAGLTVLDIKEDDEDARPFIPTQLLKFSASYVFPSLPDLKIGSSVKWQNETTTSDGSYTQDAFTLLDIAAHYQINAQLSVSLNLENLGNEKYLNSLYWSQAYFGEPRNMSATVRWKL